MWHDRYCEARKWFWRHTEKVNLKEKNKRSIYMSSVCSKPDRQEVLKWICQGRTIPFSDLFCKTENQFCTYENQFCTYENRFCNYENQFCTYENQFCTYEIQFCTYENQFCTYENQFCTYEIQFCTYENQFCTFENQFCTYENQFFTYENQFCTYENRFCKNEKQFCTDRNLSIIHQWKSINYTKKSAAIIIKWLTLCCLNFFFVVFRDLVNDRLVLSTDS